MVWKFPSAPAQVLHNSLLHLTLFGLWEIPCSFLMRFGIVVLDAYSRSGSSLSACMQRSVVAEPKLVSVSQAFSPHDDPRP